MTDPVRNAKIEVADKRVLFGCYTSAKIRIRRQGAPNAFREDKRPASKEGRKVGRVGGKVVIYI